MFKWRKNGGDLRRERLDSETLETEIRRQILDKTRLEIRERGREIDRRRVGSGRWRSFEIGRKLVNLVFSVWSFPKKL